MNKSTSHSSLYNIHVTVVKINCCNVELLSEELSHQDYVHVCTCMYMYVHVCTCMYMYVHVCSRQYGWHGKVKNTNNTNWLWERSHVDLGLSVWDLDGVSGLSSWDLEFVLGLSFWDLNGILGLSLWDLDRVLRRSYFLRFRGGLRSYMKVLVFETPSSLIELKSAAHNFDLKWFSWRMYIKCH